MTTTNFFISESSGRAWRSFERMGIISTRIYTILLITSMFILGILTRFDEKTISETMPSPSLAMVEKLRDRYSTTLSCPCEKITIPYKQFLTVQYLNHQVIYVFISCPPFSKYNPQTNTVVRNTSFRLGVLKLIDKTSIHHYLVWLWRFKI